MRGVPSPATFSAYWPGGRSRIEDVRSIGQAVALALDSVHQRGAELACVRDTHGILAFACDHSGRVWTRGHGPAGRIARWGHAS